MAQAVKTKDKNSLLHRAIRENHVELVSKLLSEGAHVNYRDINSSTPLHVAAEDGNETITRILLNFHADVNAKDRYGRTTVDTAFWNGNEQVIRALLENIDNINVTLNNRDDTPLHLAVELSSPELVNWLLEKGANVDVKKYRGKTALHLASSRGNAAVVSLLLKHGADYNCRDEDGDTPLLIASRHGREEAVNILLRYDIDVNKQVRQGETALHLLVENKVNASTIGLLLKKGAKPNVGSIINRTPLHICAIYGQSETAKTLLEYGANPDLQDTNGQTPMHLGCMQGSENVIRVLLQHNADLSIKNQLGKISLHYAAHFGCAKIVELLLLEGADPNSRNMDGRTPLAYSVCETYNRDVVSLLLQFGADINCIDRYGFTPLHIASRAAGNEMVSGLLELGANINATDWDDRTPLYLAMSVFDKNQSTVIVLENHIIMMQTVGLYICEENLYLIGNDEEIEKFRMTCQEEVDKMRKTKIGKSIISFHDVLTKSIHELVKIARNQEVEDELEVIDLSLKFPLYANMIGPIIKNNLKNAKVRKKLLDQSNHFFQIMFSNLPKLPQHCIDKIFVGLTNLDLTQFIHAFQIDL